MTGKCRLDIGEVLYAVNSFKDAHGRQILFGWLQEGERDDHGYSYAGCESVPRELLLRCVLEALNSLASSCLGLRRCHAVSRREMTTTFLCCVYRVGK